VNEDCWIEELWLCSRSCPKTRETKCEWVKWGEKCAFHWVWTLSGLNGPISYSFSVVPINRPSVYMFIAPGSHAFVSSRLLLVVCYSYTSPKNLVAFTKFTENKHTINKHFKTKSYIHAQYLYKSIMNILSSWILSLRLYSASISFLWLFIEKIWKALKIWYDMSFAWHSYLKKIAKVNICNNFDMDSLYSQ